MARGLIAVAAVVLTGFAVSLTWNRSPDEALIEPGSDSSGLASGALADNSEENHLSEASHLPAVSDYVRGLIEAEGGSSVPVLVPYLLTEDEATALAHGFRLKITSKGYSAVMRDGDIEIAITGTRETFRRGSAEPLTPDDDEGPDSNDRDDEMGLDYVMPYEDFDDDRGGTVSFGFARCHYQVEFYCKDFSDPDAGNCVAAPEAEDFVSQLVRG